ncbi:MAG TPA: alanine racemase [Solirubrobacteraceae bacterium]|nr:alanine racemase [Solirubrobacteraceae bacterium]
MALRAVARANLAAIERNTERLRRTTAGQARLCAVVKANGYGHGAAAAGRAALQGGATMLGVATAGEARELRDAGIEAPVLVLGALSAEELEVALDARGEVVAWDERFVDELIAAARAPVAVHVKLDSGMGRYGTRSRQTALAVAEQVAGTSARDAGLRLAGAMTHFATADEDPEFLAVQLTAFEPFAQTLRERAQIVVHAANSAATLREPSSHFDMVRCGIALYGCDPFNRDPDAELLEPALELGSYVAAVKLARPGESAGYGRRFIAERETWLATIPIGYGDGVNRALTNNCDILIGGRRYPMAGTVSMDNITVDVGSEPGVAVGDEAILIGRSGEERQTAEQLAHRLQTISYEVVCGISSRVTRAYHRDGAEVPDPGAGPLCDRDGARVAR